MAEWTATGDLRPPATSDITLIELVDRYWVHVRSYYVKDGKPTSEQDTVHQALAPVLKLYGLSPACEFGPLALETVRQAMVDLKWCRNYINQQCSPIRMLFGCIIHIGPRAQAILKPWLRTDLRAYVFSPADEAAAKMQGSTRGCRSE
ncbi:MAG: hypothetical protein L0Y42_13705 [Phycisphaerales bacterium]|nr:hypothetical protein [Phycisphaerales bacterium]